MLQGDDMDIVATDIAGLLFAGLLVATIAVVPLFIFRGIRAALRKLKARPISAYYRRAEFATSERQAEPRGTFDEGCYRALLREVTKKRTVK